MIFMQGRKSGSSIENLDIDRDVLGSLEKLHTSMSGTLGTMRSIRSNGSIPTLERVRREESNHSIGSHSQTSSGQVSHVHKQGDISDESRSIEPVQLNKYEQTHTDYRVTFDTHPHITVWEFLLN